MISQTIRRLCCCLWLASLAAQAQTSSTTVTTNGPAGAATATVVTPEGMVADPCAGMNTTIPPRIADYQRSLFTTPRTSVPSPPRADFETYRAQITAQSVRDWANLCRYRADDLQLAKQPQGAREVVFLGDSITENWAIADPDFFEGGVVNRGISGQTTPQMLVRFQADVVALHPRIVHIMAGTNDLAGNTGPTDMRAFMNNVIAMVDLARANRIRVVLAAIPPAVGFPWRPSVRPAAQLRMLNRWLADYARAQGLTFVDYGTVLADADGSFKKALSLDGVHPNSAGYAQIAPLAREAIRRAGRP